MLPDSAGEAGGAAAIVLAFIAFMRFFLVRQIRDLTRRVNRLEVEYDRERGLKHKAFNDVARMVSALYLVQRLAADCQCGVLNPLSDVIDRLLGELETLPRDRRHDDHPPLEGAT